MYHITNLLVTKNFATHDHTPQGVIGIRAGVLCRFVALSSTDKINLEPFASSRIEEFCKHPSLTRSPTRKHVHTRPSSLLSEEWDITESLPNLMIALKLFITVCVSVASCERSFNDTSNIRIGCHAR
ncbi:hypothetical protein J6590_084140 [Homalodisca vitripennis]|nr:hypothetical protein J6590_084140 [Homalodisca vitripennis]